MRTKVVEIASKSGGGRGRRRARVAVEKWMIRPAIPAEKTQVGYAIVGVMAAGHPRQPSPNRQSDKRRWDVRHAL